MQPESASAHLGQQAQKQQVRLFGVCSLEVAFIIVFPYYSVACCLESDDHDEIVYARGRNEAILPSVRPCLRLLPDVPPHEAVQG